MENKQSLRKKWGKPIKPFGQLESYEYKSQTDKSIKITDLDK